MTCYGCEVRVLKEREFVCVREKETQSSRNGLFKKVTQGIKIRKIVKNTTNESRIEILGRFQRKTLKCYGHIFRIDYIGR